MPWMRVSIGVGLGAMAAGVAGMLVWIEDGSHYFDLAVAVAMAGFLTLGACVLTSVFGSSHGSQDDAFRRGRSMGYDEGFLEGRRTARPVVVPLHAVDRDLDVPVGDPEDQQGTRTANVPMWRRDAMQQESGGKRAVAWVKAQRVPLLAGALSLILIGAVVATAMARTPAQTEASPQSPGELFHRAVPQTGVSPAVVQKTGAAPTLLAPVSGASPVTQAAAGDAATQPAGAQTSPVSPVSPVGQVPSAAAVSAAAVGAAAVGAAPAPAIIYLPAAGPVTSPAVQPVVAAPVVPLTAAQQTAANAKAAADLTAANAAAAAAETARVAAAAAEATRLQAAADAWAVAHPGG